VSRKKTGISSHAFRIRYLRRSREIYRRFLATKPWIKLMHSTFLGLKPGMKIVDVGCGTGDFTRYLASLIPGKCKIIGVDLRAANIRTAEKQTKKEGMAGRISFRKGDAYRIPVEDGWADLACCRTLLMHLTEPLKAVQEMTRVVRKGGAVAAFERGRFESFYIPDNERFTKLATKLANSYVDGVRKLEEKYFDIGNRLPTIFYKAGLREIMAEVQADTYLSSDPRRRLEDVRDELAFYLATFRETKKLDAKAMQAGGASKKEIDQYNRWWEKWMMGLLDDNEKLRNDTVFGAGGIVLVAGRKQAG
jgi:ubiquinone/menaquinone biosynthesis C-methylase UbiE